MMCLAFTSRPNAFFRVHESRMWLTLCMIISPQLHWSVNKSVLSVCPCVCNMWAIKWDMNFLKASVPTTVEKGVHCLLVYKAQKELTWQSEWQIQTGLIQPAYNGTAHPVVKKGYDDRSLKRLWPFESLLSVWEESEFIQQAVWTSRHLTGF